MRVRLLTARAARGLSQRAGDIVEISDAEAQRLIAAGYAAALEPETAMRAGPENAARPAGRAKSRSMT
jgi:hypothetical protein